MTHVVISMGMKERVVRERALICIPGSSGCSSTHRLAVGNSNESYANQGCFLVSFSEERAAGKRAPFFTTGQQWPLVGSLSAINIQSARPPWMTQPSSC